MHAEDFLHFATNSPSPFHAVANAKKMLVAAGFCEISEKLPWTLQPSGRYFFTRNQSSIVAFAVGKLFKPGNGISMIGAHTDSPCLKLKPVSKKESSGYLQVGVQTYGGGLWHTWFDRDLSIAGRVITSTSNHSLESHLVKIDRPLMRIPSLAIHLDRAVSEKFTFNNESQLVPILASKIKNDLNELINDTGADPKVHHSALLKAIAEELNVEPSSIIDLDLCLYDTQPSAFGGLYSEFIFSPRIDNLMMSFCSLTSLIESLREPQALESETNIRLIALFDNEEVGSESAYGAASSLLEDTLRRLSHGGSQSAFEESVHKSFLISADMAHAIHPNYSDKHEANHQPHFHKGLVIKTNANQRYATTSVTCSMIRQLASYSFETGKPRDNPIPLQNFVVKNDSPCGSTIGPILSAKLGLRTIDVGSPQLSMHSIREMAAVDDVNHSIQLFTAFFKEFPHLDKQLFVE